MKYRIFLGVLVVFVGATIYSLKFPWKPEDEKGKMLLEIMNTQSLFPDELLTDKVMLSHADTVWNQMFGKLDEYTSKNAPNLSGILLQLRQISNTFINMIKINYGNNISSAIREFPNNGTDKISWKTIDPLKLNIQAIEGEVKKLLPLATQITQQKKSLEQKKLSAKTKEKSVIEVLELLAGVMDNLIIRFIDNADALEAFYNNWSQILGTTRRSAA